MAKEKETEETQETEEKEEKKTGGSKLLLIIIIILLLVLLVIGGVFAYFLLSNNQTQSQNPQQQIEKNQKINSMTQLGPIYPLDPFIVNLVSSNADRYLKCKIDLELDTQDLQKELDKKLPAIRDIIIQILSSKSVEEIQTAKGKEKLKEEIKRKINQKLTSGEIKNIYFTEFVIQ